MASDDAGAVDLDNEEIPDVAEIAALTSCDTALDAYQSQMLATIYLVAGGIALFKSACLGDKLNMKRYARELLGTNWRVVACGEESRLAVAPTELLGQIPDKLPTEGRGDAGHYSSSDSPRWMAT